MQVYMLSLDALLEMAGVTDEIFTFVPHGETETLLFNATKIRAHCVAHPDEVTRSRVIVTEDMAKKILTNGGIETKKVMRLMGCPDKVFEPVIFLEWHDGTHVMCDGNHRFSIQVALLGMPTIDSYIVPRAVWTQYQLPSELEALIG